MTEPTGPQAAPDRRGLLLGVKLRGLIADHLGGPVDADVHTLGTIVAVPVGNQAWVLVDGPAARQLGPALAWALRAGCAGLQLLAEQDTGLLARRADQLAFPVHVSHVAGRSLLPAVAEPLPPPPRPHPDHLAVAPLIRSAGATLNVEHGVVTGEVRGLEVCRVVAEPTSGHVAEVGDLSGLVEGTVSAAPTVSTGSSGPDGGRSGDQVLLEVGVGASDREAFRRLHGDIPVAEALRDVVRSVQRHRGLAAHHPLSRMARERELRARIEADPSLLDLSVATAAEPPLPRPSLRQSVPCVAAATTVDGRDVAVVCSTGVDLDLVGFVADVQVQSGHDVVVVVPTRDLVPITTELLGLLRRPVEIRTLD